MNKIFRCKACGHTWEFAQSTVHTCTCGHRMNIKIPQSNGSRIRGISPGLTRVRIGGLKGRSNHRIGSYGKTEWKPSVHRGSSRKEHFFSRIDVTKELQKRWKKELEEMLEFAKEGLNVDHIIQDLQEKLETV